MNHTIRDISNSVKLFSSTENIFNTRGNYFSDSFNKLNASNNMFSTPFNMLCNSENMLSASENTFSAPKNMLCDSENMFSARENMFSITVNLLLILFNYLITHATYFKFSLFKVSLRTGRSMACGFEFVSVMLRSPAFLRDVSLLRMTRDVSKHESMLDFDSILLSLKVSGKSALSDH